MSYKIVLPADATWNHIKDENGNDVLYINSRHMPEVNVVSKLTIETTSSTSPRRSVSTRKASVSVSDRELESRKLSPRRSISSMAEESRGSPTSRRMSPTRTTRRVEESAASSRYGASSREMEDLRVSPRFSSSSSASSQTSSRYSPRASSPRTVTSVRSPSPAVRSTSPVARSRSPVRSSGTTRTILRSSSPRKVKNEWEDEEDFSSEEEDVKEYIIDRDPVSRSISVSVSPKKSSSPKY